MRRHGTVIDPVDVVDGTHGGIILHSRATSEVIVIIRALGLGRSLAQFLNLLFEGGNTAVLLGDGVVHGLCLVLFLLQSDLGALEFSLDIVALGGNLGEVGSALVAVNAQRVVLALIVLGHGCCRSQLLLEPIDDIAGLNAAAVLHVGILLGGLLQLVDGLGHAIALILEDDVRLAQLVKLRATRLEVDDLLPERGDFGILLVLELLYLLDGTLQFLGGLEILGSGIETLLEFCNLGTHILDELITLCNLLVELLDVLLAAGFACGV